MKRILIQLHRWVGLVSGPLVLVAALTTLGLNHRELYAPRKAEAPSGLYGRYLKDLAVAPTAPARMVAGTDRGLFLSEDGGRTWTEASTPVPAEAVEDVEFDPLLPRRVHAALRAGVLLRSEDGGRTWEVLETPLEPGTQLAGLGSVPGGVPNLLTSRGVYRSQGTSWTLEPRPEEGGGDERGRSLLRLVYNLHDGTFWGRWGVWVTDGVALVLLALVLSGYALGLRRRPSRPVS